MPKTSPARFSRPLALCVLCAALAFAAARSSRAAVADEDFSRWLTELEAEAIENGISPDTARSALRDVEPIPRVIELDRKQPKAPSDFCRYLDRRLTATRIARSKRVLVEHRDLLHELSEEYGVPPRYLVALWGLETNFGDYMGDFPVIPALVTLAHDSRRGELFRGQVLAALRIVDEGHPPDGGFLGSWAGATGQVQLMPTTFLEYAVDHDGDGRKNVWTSLPDALATAAHYLRRSGWRSGETWGRQVSLPAELHSASALRKSRPLSEWKRSGVMRPDGGALPDADLRGSIVLPMRVHYDPAFLIYRNYRTFLAWNNSTFFAISVGALADEITGRDSLRVCGAGSG